MQDKQIFCHKLGPQDAADEALTHVFALSKKTFAATEDAHRASNQLSEWQKHLRRDGSGVLYVTHAKSQDVPLGFVFVLLRTAPELGIELPHIWLAAVDPASRGSGVFALLMQQATQLAQSTDAQSITVCTYPKRFERMYAVLQQHGWQEMARRENGEKVLMKLDLAV
ncbi:hypothetical protein CBER1_00443 [Cercospora berteroae]|uniref:N-acetyltransferase domain-containing protein n=1 Tax=Cercospora berteroae TaxID=357750 RepID=A0A2S6C1K6_9PEZI|nr:hypothetical protein CBER1_00443 [Cercospora berteroae]